MKKIALLVLLIAGVSSSHAQDAGGTQVPDVAVPTLDQLVKIPQSPEAAAFEKYGNNDISLYTGTANISIPVGIVEARGYQLPISLTYDASGVKVEQIATSVGLGWNLNAGGTVTRKVNGLPDDYLGANPGYLPFYSNERPQGQMSVKEFYYLMLSSNIIEGSLYEPGIIDQYFYFLDLIRNDKLDLQPDTYSFSINGLSGTIVINYEDTTAYCVEHPDIKVIPKLNPATSMTGGTMLLTGWIIYDNQGNKYLFDQVEKTNVRIMDDLEKERTYYSAWYISDIITASNRDIIHFTYNTLDYWEQPQLAGRGEMRKDLFETEDCKIIELPIPQQPEYRISQVELKEIVAAGIKQLEISNNKQRLDLKGKNAIDTLKSYSISGKIKNVYVLHTSYFGDENTASILREEDIRLRLDSISIYGKNLVSIPKKYRFTYYGDDNSLPSRNSMAQDYWGYFNGIENTTLIPRIPELDDRITGFYGANRKSSKIHSIFGNIKRVQYPTGGYTEFFYRLPSYLENVTKSIKYVATSVTVNGGTDASGPASICYDVDPNVPIIFDRTFNVDKTGNYKLSFGFFGTPQDNSALEYNQIVIIYEGALQSFCDLYFGNVPSVVSYEGKIYPNTDLGLDFSLESGKTYHILVGNNQSGVSLTASVWQDRVISTLDTLYVGANQLYRQVDYGIDNQEINTTYYYYDDLSFKDKNIVTKNFLENNIASSGILHQPPLFTDKSIEEKWVAGKNRGDIDRYVTCEYINRYSNSRGAGSPHLLTYNTVTTVQFRNGKMNGFTVYDFYNENEYNGNLPHVFKNALNGKEKSVRIFDADFNLVQKSNFNYVKEGISTTPIAGIVFESNLRKDYEIQIHSDSAGKEFYYSKLMLFGGQTWESSNGSFSPSILQPCVRFSEDLVKCIPGPIDYYQKRTYSLGRYRSYLKDKTLYFYQGSELMSNHTEYFYGGENNFYQLDSVVTQNSTDDVLSTTILYAHSYANVDDNLQQLINEHRIAEPIEITTYKNTQKLFTKKNLYGKFGGMVLIDTIEQAIGENTLEPKIEISAYDSYGNIRQIRKINDVENSYLWGYGGTRIIAVVQNAVPEQVYYNDFEQSGFATTDYTLAHSGQKYVIKNNFPMSFQPPDNLAYVIDYWYYDGTKWNLAYNEPYDPATFSFPSAAVYLDDIRIYPKTAIMKNYIYGDNGQVAGILDENCQLTTYQYDDFGRLINVKDQDKKLLQEIEYHYYNEN